MKNYAPARGDIIWLNMSPQAGHEQAGHRPALVLSPISYNRKTGLAIVCPLTMKPKGYSFEVATRINKQPGAVLADHVKNVDWVARGAKPLATIDKESLARVSTIVTSLTGEHEKRS